MFEQGEESVRVVRPYNCVVGCGSCQSVYPSGAIGFSDMRQFIETLKKLREEYGDK